MLIALMIALFYGSGGVSGTLLGELTLKHLKAEVKAAIPDEARRELALKALSKATDDIEDLNEKLQEDLAGFEELVRDHDSRPADFDRLFEARSADHLRRVDRIWAHRAAMLQHVQPEEWSTIIQRARASRDATAKPAGKPGAEPKGSKE
jgi:hypothetical protein